MAEPPKKYVLPLRFASSPNGTRNLPPTTPERGTGGERDEAINAAFQEVLRQQTELTSAIDRLRAAISASGKDIGIGHNQGPPISIAELDEESGQLLALLQDKGPKPSFTEQAVIATQAEKVPKFSERITVWSKTLATEGAKIGAREVAKNVTAPFWVEVARRLLDLYHAIKFWLSQLL